VAHQEIGPWNTDMVEDGITIISAVVGHLQTSGYQPKLLRQNPEVLPNVTKLNTRNRLEVLQGTQLNHERMNTMVLAADY
jgi:hypothetical protein